MTCTTPTHKTCPTCQIPKPLTEFWKSSKHGVQSYYKICQNIRKRGGLPSAPRKPKATKTPKTPETSAQRQRRSATGRIESEGHPVLNYPQHEL